MIDFEGQIVTIVGRLSMMPRRVAAAEIERQGGVLRHGLVRQTTYVVIAKKSYAQLACGRLLAQLACADRIGAACISEQRFFASLGLVPADPPIVGAVRLDYFATKTKLRPDVIRLLVLFDVVRPQDGQYSFCDLIAARDVARLLGEGVDLADILASSAEAGRGPGSADDQPLARLRLVSDPGQRAARFGRAPAELDDQLRLALPGAKNSSFDELFDAAEAAEQAGELTAAEALYRCCVRLDKRDPIAPFNLANVLRELGKVEPAEQHLRHAVGIDPLFADAWYNLALLHNDEGNRTAAIKAFERATAAEPEFGDALYNLAMLRLEAGDFAEAGRLWQRYLALDPDSEWSDKARHRLAFCDQHGATK